MTGVSLDKINSPLQRNFAVQIIQNFLETVGEQRVDLFLQVDGGGGAGPAGGNTHGQTAPLHQGGKKKGAGVPVCS